MREDTDVLHQHASAIGEQLGFRVQRELSLAHELASDYAPRLDVGWLHELSAPQLAAIRKVGAKVPIHGDSLLVAGWEIEGSDASTRGMQSDIANLRVSGAAYGFLGVTGGTRDNLWSRAVKLARAQRYYFGVQGLAVLDARWLAELASVSWSRALQQETWKNAVGGGGEGEWARGIRSKLRQLGSRAGFVVVESYGSRLPAGRGMTRSQIDLVWALPMPEGLAALARQIEAKGQDARNDDAQVPASLAHVAVVAFELENDAKKHGGGALLNLASHGVAGVFVAGTEAAALGAASVRATYAHHFPLSRVSINQDYAE